MQDEVLRFYHWTLATISEWLPTKKSVWLPLIKEVKVPTGLFHKTRTIMTTIFGQQDCKEKSVELSLL